MAWSKKDIRYNQQDRDTRRGGRKGNCAVCNGKGTINRIKPGTANEVETVPCPQSCAATR